MILTRRNRPLGFGLAPWQLSHALPQNLGEWLESVSHALSSSGPSPFTAPFPAGRFPALDVHEDKTSVTFRAEVPGLKKEEINISLHDGVLTLSGERKANPENDGNGAFRRERWVGRFERQIPVPGKVDPQTPSATYVDGVLTVTLKKAEVAKPRQIKIEFN